MKHLVVLGLFAALAVGCKSPTATSTGDAALEIDYIVPTDVIVLVPDQPKEIPIERKGKGEMKETDLSAETSHPSLKATPSKFAKDANKASVTVQASKDTPTDTEHTVTVKAGSQSKTFKVKVEKPK